MLANCLVQGSRVGGWGKADTHILKLGDRLEPPNWIPASSLSLFSLPSTPCELGLPQEPLLWWHGSAPFCPLICPHALAFLKFLATPYASSPPLWASSGITFCLSSARNALLIQTLPLSLLMALLWKPCLLPSSPHLSFFGFSQCFHWDPIHSVGPLVLNEEAPH